MADYVLRFGSDPYVWLVGEVPNVMWGPERNALHYKTHIEVHQALARLRNYEPLSVVKIGA